MEFSGVAAEHVRYAEVLQRAGDPAEAICLLESTLELHARTNAELPGWLCGRLAALYRALKRYDDEVALLERYRESQTSEEARTRFDARLSKARAIADRKRRSDTRALASVRVVLNRRDDGDVAGSIHASVDGALLSHDVRRALSSALADAASAGDEPLALAHALGLVCVEARLCEVAPERLVGMLKEIWRGTPLPAGVHPADWEATYRSALRRLLANYFGEPG